MKSTENIDHDTWELVRKIATNIKAQRKLNGWTQEDMAIKGFGVRWLQRIESGRHIPTIPTLHRLAKMFGTDISELLK